MNNIKKLILLFLSTFLFVPITATTYTTTPSTSNSVNGYQWQYMIIKTGKNATCAIVGTTTAASGVLQIPATVTDGTTTYTVITVAYNSSTNAKSFRNNTNITGLSFDSPANITTIDDLAFSGCTGLTGSLDLTKFTSLTTIGNSAFYGCQFSGDLTIPSTVTTLGTSAFYGNTKLTSTLTINATGLTTILSSTFQNCGFTSTVTIPNNITSIGSSAFNGCTGITGVTLSTALTSIGVSAFQGCTGLTGISAFPSTLASIANNAFDGCTSLTGTINLSALTGPTTIGDYAFQNCQFTGDLTLSNAVTSIGVSAFAGNTKLTGALTINATGLTTIPTSCFSSCGFTNIVTIPNNITSIGAYAFNGCNSIQGVTISQNLQSIESAAFQGCTSLKVLSPFPSTLQTIGSFAFVNCTSLTGTLDFSQTTKLTTIGDKAFRFCKFTGTLSIPKTVTSIGSNAFEGLNIRRCDFAPNTILTSLNSSVWASCNNLEYIDMSGVTAKDSTLTPKISGITTLSRTANTGVYPFGGLQDHTVVYIPDGFNSSLVTSDLCNYVYKGQCLWLSIQDAYDYYLPHAFTASKASYNNTGTTNYRQFSGTTCKTVYLPYPSTVPTGMRAYTLTKQNTHTDGILYMVFTSVPDGSTLAANTPYIVRITDGSTTAKTFPDITTSMAVPATPRPTDTAKAATMDNTIFYAGTTENIDNATAAAGKYYNLSNNVWYPITTGNTAGLISHFRCFLYGNSLTLSKSMNITFEELDGSTTSIQLPSTVLQDNPTKAVYSIDGRFIGTDLNSLPKGLYIVGGKKIMKY